MILVFTHLVELQCVDRSPIRSCLWLIQEQGVLRVVMPGSTGVLPAAYSSTVSLAFQSDRHPCTLLDLHPSPNSLSLSLSLSQPIFAFEKSISGCSFMNFCNSSFFLLSS